MSDNAPIEVTERTDASTWPLIFGTIAALVIAFGLAVTAVVYANKDDDTDRSGSSTPASVDVALSEFAIDPATITVAQGGSLEVTNAGSAAHNLAVTGEDLTTADLSAGDAESLDISSLAEGSYEVICTIPGHADAGMRGSLEVVTGGGAVAAPSEDTGDHSAHGDEMDYQKMTDDMLATMAAFPAETEGKGNEPLEPTEVLSDGTKVFDMTMELAEWEVEPGKVVDAWTFNGMVPGPMMKLAVGDKVQVRIQNDLPIATDVHFHGLNVPNSMDGVAPITQPLIEPGESFTYEFTTDEQAVAMYHPHAHGHKLLPDGMFGVVLVDDVRLPLGQTIGLEQVPADLTIAQEIPMVLNDAGVIGFSLNGKSFPATEPYAAQQGDWILVHYYNEGTQIHPMHLHQFDQIVVAKDGYPVDAPYTADTVNVAPGERYSVLVQLDAPGVWVWHCHILPHVEREAGMFGMVTAVIVE